MSDAKREPRKTTVDLAKLGRLFEQLRSQSSGARSVWDELERYVMPRVGGDAAITERASEASAIWKNPDRWDSTAPVALGKLVAHVHGSLMPPGSQWFSGAFPLRELMQDKASKEWIEGNAKILWQSLEESDFQSQIGSGLQEWTGLGNTMVVQEVEETPDGKWRGLDYTAVPVRETEFEETSRGAIRTWFRELRWTPAQMVDRFGAEGVPEVIRKRLESGTDATSSETVLFCVFERPEVLAKPATSRAPPLAPELRPYGSVYLLLDGYQQLGEEGGYYDHPAYVARWERTPGSRWGHGLGHMALPDVKWLNSWLERDLEARALAMGPPILSEEDGIIGDPEIAPNAILNVRDINGVKTLEHQGRFDVAANTVLEQRAQIRRLFREDALDLKDSPQMTAMEAQLRFDIMLKLIGPTLARFQSEFLDPMLTAAYRALWRAGRFPDPPPLVKQKGEEFAFTYLGPNARARKLDRVAAHERGASYVAGLRKMGFEEVKHVFRPIQSVREVFEDLGIPSTVLASEADVKKAQQAEANLAMRAMQAEAARAEGEALEQRATGMAAASQVSTTEPLPASPVPILTPPLPGAA